MRMLNGVPLVYVISLLIFHFGPTPASFAEGEYEWRYFTKIKSSKSGELLTKTITARIKIVSRIDEKRFKAITWKEDESESKPFVLSAADFSTDDQKYLEQWNPDLAVDLSDYPIETILTSAGYLKIPLPKRNNRFEVKVKINGKPVVLILDTGAQGTILTSEAAERLGIANGQEIGQAMGIAGKPVMLYESRIKEFILGELETGKRTIHYCDIGIDGKDGLFGFDDIHRLKAIIDYGKEAIYVKKVAEGE